VVGALTRCCTRFCCTTALACGTVLPVQFDHKGHSKGEQPTKEPQLGPPNGCLVCSASGLLSRPRIHLDCAQGLELHKAPAALPGVVLTPADPNNLEPEAGASHQCILE
jgi:hypothetical protein